MGHCQTVSDLSAHTKLQATERARFMKYHLRKCVDHVAKPEAEAENEKDERVHGHSRH